MNNIEIKNVTEEYIDDPHWNSGFWETTVQFNDDLTAKRFGRKSDFDTIDIIEIYASEKSKVYQKDTSLKDSFNRFVRRSVVNDLTIEDIIEKLNQI